MLGTDDEVAPNGIELKRQSLQDVQPHFWEQRSEPFCHF